MSFSCPLKICHSIENFYLKFERLFLVGRVSKKFFVAPKLTHKFKYFVVCWTSLKKILNDIYGLCNPGKWPSEGLHFTLAFYQGPCVHPGFFGGRLSFNLLRSSWLPGFEPGAGFDSWQL